MRYFANPSTPAVRDAMTAGLLAAIATPKQGNRVPPGVPWCADNGCGPGRGGVKQGTGYPGDAAFLAWLQSYTTEEIARCVFAVAPDVVADAAATLTRSAPWLPVIRGLGYPVAFVAQDGQESLPVPWDEFDVLFIGGSTAWKLSEHAHQLATEAKAHGKHVHMGRVNSLRRLRFAQWIGADSCDGTLIAHGPDVRLPQMLGFLRNLDQRILDFGAIA